MGAVARTLIRASSALGFLVVIVTATPVVSWWARALAGTWEDPSGDVLIVLGGSELPGGVLGESSYWRSVYAARAYHEGKFRAVVVTGGGSSQRSIAEAMGDFLQLQGVPASVIHVETHSTSTRENALFCKEILGRIPGTKVLLTSDYHMTRASRTFRKAGVAVLPRPFPDAIKRGSSWTTRWGAFLDLWRETIALGYYYLRGWI